MAKKTPLGLPQNGFVKFTLDRDFEHDQYSNVLSRQLIAAATFANNQFFNGAYYLDSGGDPFIHPVTGKTPNQVVLPNAPYTPAIKAITLDYTSQVTLSNTPVDNNLFIHIQPFENTYQQFNTVSDVKLLPQLHKYAASTETYNIEGALILGLRDLKPKQSLSILFQVAENTADADAEVAKVKWQYLAGNSWFDFKEYEITKETTNGFLTSGIITFAIPDKIDLNNTILSNQLHWIRAWVETDSVAVSEMINIHAQAIQLNFQDNSNDPAFLATPLAAATIAKLEIDDAAIDSI
ncbi:MAG: hypothetical protein HC896_05085 [Bacteroidales bacterium]|nr:hypothetical protein [Bacteroidales bacterium]